MLPKLNVTSSFFFALLCSVSKRELSNDVKTIVAWFFALNHGIMIQTGITCKKIPL